ncbi:MAG: hypothetical protein GY934_19680, partial [Gammaproteobacteria bacterium]|nr:hypothetical protein [Gammaproteobacteria bacterium]
YYADVGGRILRLDVPDTTMTDVNDIDGDSNTTEVEPPQHGIIADINTGTGANAYRSFFNTPEVGYFSKGGVQYLAVLIGSGHRPKPLDMPSNSEADRFYMIKDREVWRAPASGSYTKVDHGSLVDADSTSDVTDGWYLDVTHVDDKTGVEETYKVFSKAKLYNYDVLFTAYRGYTVGDVASDPCVGDAAKGKAVFFAVKMGDGSASFADMDGEDPGGPATDDDRSVSLLIPGIPPSPTLLFPEIEGGLGFSGEVRAIVGLEEVQKWYDRFHAVYWEEVIE